MENRLVITNKLSHVLNTGGGDVILDKNSYSQYIGKVISGYCYYKGNKFECKYQLVDTSSLVLKVGELVYIDSVTFKASKNNPSKSNIVGFVILDKPIDYISYVLVAGLTKVLPIQMGELGDDVFVEDGSLSANVCEMQILGARFIEKDIIGIENY